MQKPLRYILVDDDELDALHVEALASTFPFLQKVASCSNAVEGLEIISQMKPDIVFADIEMPGISGIGLIQSVAGIVPAPVFITSHPEFALDGYELHVFDYLLKPVSTARFHTCAQRLAEFFQLRTHAFAFAQEQESNFIIIKQGYDKYRILINDILYLEAMKDYTKVVTTTKTYLVLETFGNMQQKLSGGTFTRIHRSYIVNTGKITVIRDNKVCIHDLALPVGKMYRKAIIDLL